MAWQHNTQRKEQVQQAARKWLLQPFQQFQIKVSFNLVIIHNIKLVSWPNTEEGGLGSEELRMITKYATAIPRLKARPVVLRKVPLETNVVFVVTQHLI